MNQGDRRHYTSPVQEVRPMADIVRIYGKDS